jgi:predicted dehydrogenase
MKPVRVGVLGTGAIVREFHLPALAVNARARSVALANLRPHSLEALSRQYAIGKTYTDFERMAEDPEIDAVINALPNHLHAPVTVTMLRAGKHVLCEKPMAMNLDEARAMIEATQNGPSRLMIGYVWRCDSQMRSLRDSIAAGEIGKVLRAKGHSIVGAGGPPSDGWRVRLETAGGGALADVGSHTIDGISFLFHDRIRPVQVWTKTGTYFRPIEVEDTATVVIEYDSGMVAEIEAGWFHACAENPHGTIELFGTHGYARTLPLLVKAGGQPGACVWTSSFSSQSDHITMPMYAAQIDRFLDCIVGGSDPPCDGHQGLRDMITLEAAYRSARERSAITLSE